MAAPRESWEEVGERLSELGLKLKLHVEQAEKGRSEAETEVTDALRSVGDAIDRAFTALGNAVKDDAVREDARDVGQSMIDALDATFSELGERFRAVIKRD